MPALPPSILEPSGTNSPPCCLTETTPIRWAATELRIPDRVIFDKLIQVLVRERKAERVVALHRPAYLGKQLAASAAQPARRAVQHPHHPSELRSANRFLWGAGDQVSKARKSPGGDRVACSGGRQ